MSKTFGKIVLASTILAGAAVGAYSYLKKEGKLPSMEGDNEGTADKMPRGSMMADVAADVIAKERNYVDLAATTLEKPASKAACDITEAADVEESKEETAEEPETKEEEAEVAFEEGIKAEAVDSNDKHVIGKNSDEATTEAVKESEEFFNDED